MPNETPHIREQRTERAVVLLARRERQVVTTAELRAAGAGRSWVQRRRESGWLVRQFRGVYLAGGRARATRDELERAAVKACGEGAVLSHRSAAVRWRLRKRYPGPVEVTAPTRRRSRGRLRAYEARLEPSDVTIKDGVPITTLARTLVDLAGVIDEQELGVAVHEADAAKRLHLPTVDRAVRRAGRCRRGRAALQRRLADHRPTEGRLDTDMEKTFVGFLHHHGFPPTRHGVLFDLGDGDRTSVDVLFDDAWVAIELDGGVHQSRRHFHRDRRIPRRLAALHGLLTIRVTEEDLLQRPDEVAHDLRATLERRAGRG